MNLEIYRKRLTSNGATETEKLDYRNKVLFEKALKGAYNSEHVQLNGSDYKALMLDDKLTLDVDQKWFCMPLESGLKIGDVIDVIRQDSHWIMVQEDMTSRSYKRLVGKRALTQVSWRDEDDTIHSCWAALRGPTETTTRTESRKHLMFDAGNEKTNIWLPANETTKILKRYAFLMIEGSAWEIASIDKLTTPGLLEISLTEAQDNVFLDNSELGIARDGKFEFSCLFDNDTTFELNTPLSVNPILSKDNKDITLTKELDFEITTDAQYEYDPELKLIEFKESGDFKIEVGYPSLKIKNEYAIHVNEVILTKDEYYSLEGNGSIIPYVNEEEEYDVERYINGVYQDIEDVYEWKYDTTFVKNIKSETANHIDIVFNVANPGSFMLEYLINGEVVASKKITIHTMFG